MRRRKQRSACQRLKGRPSSRNRSEEHTSELQSQSNLVCRLLLEKKKKNRLHSQPLPNEQNGGRSISCHVALAVTRHVLKPWTSAIICHVYQLVHALQRCARSQS